MLLCFTISHILCSIFFFFLSTCHPKQPKHKQNRCLIISSAQRIILIPTVEFSFIAASGSERCLYKLDLCLSRKENIFHTVPLWLWLMWANKERGKKKMGTLGEKNSKLISLATVRTSQGILVIFLPFVSSTLFKLCQLVAHFNK